VIATLESVSPRTRAKVTVERGSRSRDMLVCDFRETVALFASAGAGAAMVDCKPAVIAASNRKRLNVALLPKSAYVLRVIELPPTPPAELGAAIGLEIEARLPQQYGEFDFSYRQIASSKVGIVRYETYAARRSALHRTIEMATAAGVALDWILPSAAVWSHLLEANETIHVMVLSAPGRGGEVVFAEASGATAVREIPPSEVLSSEGALSPSLVDCLRSRATRLEAGMPLNVAWVGEEVPEADRFTDGRVLFTRWTDGSDAGDSESVAPLLVAARAVPAVLEGAGPALNLLPRDVIERQARRETLRRLVAIGALLGLTLLCTCGALRVLLWRYRGMNDKLATDISSIRVDADAVGLRLAQLRAIRAAAESRASFFHITESLFDCTPAGVSYSQLELHDDGRFDLRGQADSLAQPFLLPEKLQSSGTFQQVLLRDASQSAHGEGSLVEFRIDANRSKTP
jgi:hypothetical protein